MAGTQFLNPAGLHVQTVTITSAGTAQNPVSVKVPDGVGIVIQAHPSNTGSVKVADTAAKAQAAIGVGNIPLIASQGITLQLQDPSIIFLDAVTTNDRFIIYCEY